MKKTKFLRYSHSKLNQVVWHYAELKKVGDGVYTYLRQKDPYREEDDMIAIVLQLENVFFEQGAYSRRHLSGKNVTAAGTEFLANFHSNIELTMQEGRHLQLLFVRIYEELGHDAGPLIRYREERQLRLQQEAEEQKRRKEYLQRQAEEQQRMHLQQAGNRVPRRRVHLLRGFYRAVQTRTDSHTAPHARDSAPERDRTLPKQYPSQTHERQSLPEAQRMLCFGRSPVRKTHQDNGFECDIETHAIMIVCNICGGTDIDVPPLSFPSEILQTNHFVHSSI